MAVPRQIKAPELTEAPAGDTPHIPAGEAPKMDWKMDWVVARYSRYVATIGFRILGRRGELDDLLQDVFLEAHRNLHTLRDREALRPWLATVTVRVARRMLRLRQLARIFLPMGSMPSFDPVDPNTSTDELLIHRRVYGVLDRLPANQRIAWTLQVMQGESLQDIAAICGCSVAAVKRRVAKAQTVVNQELGQ